MFANLCSSVADDCFDTDWLTSGEAALHSQDASTSPVVTVACRGMGPPCSPAGWPATSTSTVQYCWAGSTTAQLYVLVQYSTVQYHTGISSFRSRAARRSVQVAHPAAAPRRARARGRWRQYCTVRRWIRRRRLVVNKGAPRTCSQDMAPKTAVNYILLVIITDMLRISIVSMSKILYIIVRVVFTLVLVRALVPGTVLY